MSFCILEIVELLSAIDSFAASLQVVIWTALAALVGFQPLLVSIAINLAWEIAMRTFVKCMDWIEVLRAWQEIRPLQAREFKE